MRVAGLTLLHGVELMTGVLHEAAIESVPV